MKQSLLLISLLVGIAGCSGPATNAPVTAAPPVPEIGPTAEMYRISAEVIANTRPSILNVKYEPPKPAAPKPKPEPEPFESKWGNGWETYGDWHVKALHDDMDTVTHVRLFTEFTRDGKPAYQLNDDPNFGLSIFGGTLAVMSNSMYLGGKDYWPFCESDLASTSVDGGKAVRIATISQGGSCNRVSMGGSAISQFKTGQQARLRIHYDDGMISLKGFSAAWSRAIQLGSQ